MNKYYPKMFEEIRIGTKVAKNRLVMSPMGNNMANADGSISDQQVAYYGTRAKGGVGTIVAGVTCIDYPRGKTNACQDRADGEKYVPGWQRLAREVHRYGTLLIMQLHHAGAATDEVTAEGLPPYRVSDPDPNGLKGQLPGSHMQEDYDVEQHVFHTLSHDEILMLEQKYIKAAMVAQMAGVDGVELHAITYLVCQFMTQGINFRTDEYGGSLENRMRFPLNIIRGIRKACGRDFIIGVRMPVHMWETDGFTDEESIQIAKAFEEAGCDYLDACGGIPPTVTCLLESPAYEQGDRVVLAEKIRPHVHVPVFVAGLLREPDFIEKVLEEDRTDCVKVGRTLLCDPEWPNKARTGRANEIRRCISCLSNCNGNLEYNKHIQCCLNPKLGIEYWLRGEPAPERSKKVVVVGGGIGGMQAAITAKERGHEVVLLEASDKLGGQLHLAMVPPNKKYMPWALEWFEGEVKRKNINVKLNCKADVDTILSYQPDAVILATGSLPWAPPIPGIEKAVETWDILGGKVEIPTGKKVVIIGGGTVGCETAEYLVEHGNQVTIVEMLSNYAAGLNQLVKIDLNKEFSDLGINVLLNATAKEITDTEIVYEQGGELKRVATEYTVKAIGQKPTGGELKQPLEDAGVEVTVIGDAKKQANIFTATQTGFYAALNL